VLRVGRARAVGGIEELLPAAREQARGAGIGPKLVVAGQQGGNTDEGRILLSLLEALIGQQQRGQGGIAVESARLQGGIEQASVERGLLYAAAVRAVP
jgi:hypothetical protein